MKRQLSRMEQDQLAAEVGMESVDKEEIYNPVGTITNWLMNHFSKGVNQNGNTL